MTWYCVVPASSMRSEPGHKAEMVNQLVFGELCDMLEDKGEFMKVKARYDGYEGWVQKRQYTALAGESYPFLTALTQHTMDVAEVNGVPLHLSPGSVRFLPDSQDPFKIGPYNIHFTLAQSSESLAGKPALQVVQHARKFLGTPYLWGGRSTYGIDCSGLTQICYKLAGKFLPRDSGPQSREGEVVGFLQEARPGDLAFFDNEEGRIVHVGILISPTQIIHASANCRLDPIDNQGIIHRETGERTHKLRVIKRFF
jgi:hypothetical protein